MRAVVVYESLYGNSRKVAEAVAEGLKSAGAEVDCLRVDAATAELVAGADLLVVGGPTQMMGMSSQKSRDLGLKMAANKGAADQVEPKASVMGVREWLTGIPAVSNKSAAAFDTRVKGFMSGGAAKGIARGLEDHGYKLAVKPEGFKVGGTFGPLAGSELERARAWGAGLTASSK